MTYNALKWGLLASVIINAFLLGVEINLLKQPHDFPPPMPPPDRMIEELIDRLPKADAALLEQAYERERNHLQLNPMDMHRQIRQALLADPFDAKKLEDIVSAEEQRHASFGAAMARMLVYAAREMSPEGRRMLADFRPGPPPPPPPPPFSR